MNRRVVHNIARVMREAFSGLEELTETLPDAAKAIFKGYPPVNVYEQDDAYVVRAEVAGLEAEDLELSLKGCTLTIEGEEKEEAEYQDLKCVSRERDAGRFCRTVELPEDVDEEAEPEATLSRGVLTVKLPREHAARARRVKVSGTEEPKKEEAESEEVEEES